MSFLWEVLSNYYYVVQWTVKHSKFSWIRVSPHVHGIRESFRLEKILKISSQIFIQALPSLQGDHVCKCHISKYFKYPQGWWLYHCPGQPYPVFDSVNKSELVSPHDIFLLQHYFLQILENSCIELIPFKTYFMKGNLTVYKSVLNWGFPLTHFHLFWFMEKKDLKCL